MRDMFFTPRSTGNVLPESATELLDALDSLFLSIVKLELNTGKAWLLHSKGKHDQQPYEFDWKDFFNFYRLLVDPKDAKKLSVTLTLSKLKELWIAKNDDVESFSPVEVNVEGLEIRVRFATDEQRPIVYIFTRQSKESTLLRRIINLYVYNNCDYFIYLDAENNSYTMFSSKEGTPLPPAICADYSAELIKYAENFVVPEDREMVIREMALDRVTAELEKHEVHAFSCGVWEEGGYARKRLEYRYYDREQRKILLSRADITELYNEQQRHFRELKNALQQAQTDPLTGLLNYRGIQDIVRQRLEDTHKKRALFFLDLDNFKKVNDTYGHGEGDRALVKIAETLKHNIRANDHAARVGGDEFVIFFDDISPAQAAECAQRICAHLEQLSLESTMAQLSCSIGIALFPEEGINYEALVKIADAKAYRAKRNGKNRFEI